MRNIIWKVNKVKKIQLKLNWPPWMYPQRKFVSFNISTHT